MRNDKFNLKLPDVKGFTLMELLVIVAAVLILAAMAASSFRFFGQSSDLNNNTEEIVNALRMAQQKTLASESASQYGVYFSTSSSPHQYTLFKGASYALRDVSFDEIHQLSKKTEIFEINLLGAREAVFSKVSGNASPSGVLKLRLSEDVSKTAAVSIDQSGRIVAGQELSPDNLPNPRDSRHLHFAYNANSQDALILKLVFPDFPADNLEINFQTYLNGDKTEFFWEGVVSVGPAGSKTEQKLKIHTHSLTSLTSQFSLHRDRRYNDKALWLVLADNGLDEELIRYSADGLTTTKGQSVYVSEPEWQ